MHYFPSMLCLEFYMRSSRFIACLMNCNILTGMIFWWSIFLRHGAIGAVAWYFKPLYMSCLNFLPFRSLNFKLYTLAIIEYSSMVKTYRSYNTSFLPPFFRNLHGRKQPKLSERGAIPHPICLLVNEAVCIY